jgi:hypothetical protein
METALQPDNFGVIHNPRQGRRYNASVKHVS